MRESLLQEDLCHREPEFASLCLDITGRLASLYLEARERYAPILLAGSGTCAVEAMLATVAPGHESERLFGNGFALPRPGSDWRWMDAAVRTGHLQHGVRQRGDRTRGCRVLRFLCASQISPNLTDQARRVLYITYNAVSEGDHLQQYYADKSQSYPPDIEREAGRDYVFRV